MDGQGSPALCQFFPLKTIESTFTVTDIFPFDSMLTDEGQESVMLSKNVNIKYYLNSHIFVN